MASKTSIIKDLAKMTKSALYRLAQRLMVPGRSKMTKPELVSVLTQKKNEVEPIVDSISKPARTVKKENSMAKAKTQQDQVKPSLPKENTTVQMSSESFSSSVVPAKKEPVVEPGHVWVGEEGPELPRGYGNDVLRALPRDPHWIFLYWEISNETKNRLIAEKGEWIFDVSEPVLRIYGEDGKISQEVPILLDAMQWYLSVQSNRSYEFELALKHGNDYLVLVRSKPVSMPSSEPSSVMDEEWAVVEEQFDEMVHQAAGFDSSWGGSAALPHILRHRIRVPWSIPAQEWPSPEWPSSHVLGGISSKGISSTVLQKK